MPDKKITTIQGQAWDQIARTYLGAEKSMHKLLSANWQCRGVLLFSGDRTITVPEADTLKAASPVESIPPWKR